jgi:hypothetical protein
MGTILFILLIAFVFIGVPLLLPRFIIWLTESRATSETVMQPGTSHLPPIADKAVSKGIACESEELAPPRTAIALLRGIAGLILGIVWPLATLSLPFLLDDPREAATVGRFVYLALYVAYPLVFFISAGKYKAQLLNGHYGAALAHAASPIGILLGFSLLLWGVSNLNP